MVRRTAGYDPHPPLAIFWPVTDVLCELPFAEFFDKNRIRCKRSLPDFHQRCEQDCSRPAAFKNATVRERPEAAGWSSLKRPFDKQVARRPGRAARGSRTTRTHDHWIRLSAR